MPGTGRKFAAAVVVVPCAVVCFPVTFWLALNWFLFKQERKRRAKMEEDMKKL